MGDRIEALRDQVGQMEVASQFLEHILTFHHDSTPDGCEHYEALIWERHADH
jgi:hypothetical protein